MDSPNWFEELERLGRIASAASRPATAVSLDLDSNA